ncbi:MAG: GAF domain-containing protein [Leptospira sp.]|nr:GAF domain-containing protein [Leptospira sp.]NCS92731.1 GAF domain-containing protein [Leptospira sp.]
MNDAKNDSQTNKEEIISIQENIDLLNSKLKRKNLEFSVIQILSNEIITSLDLDRIFQIAMESLDKYFGFSHSLILLKNSGSDFLKVYASHGYCGQGIGATVKTGEGVIGVVAKRKKMMRSSGMGYRKIYVQSIQKSMDRDQVVIPMPGLQNVNCQLAIPLIVKDELIGVYAIESEEFNAFAAIDEQILMIVGNQIGSAISNARAYKEIEELKNSLEEKVIDRTKKLENQKKEIQSLNQFIKSLNEKMDLSEISSKILKYVKEHFGIQHYSLYTVDPSGDTISPIYIHYPEKISNNDRLEFESLKIPIKNVKGANALAIQSQKPWYFKRIKKIGITKEELFAIERLNMKSFLMIPLFLQGKPVGILNFWNDEEMSLKKEDITRLSIFSEQLAGIIYSSQLFDQVEREKEKSDHLLLNILPHSIATELKETNQVKPQHIKSASVLFTDFVGFTQISEDLSPEELIKELDGCFSQFDEISKHNNLEKLKTIGDAYMCAGGLPIPNDSHPIDICLAALEFRSFMNQMSEIKKALNLPFWELRIGIHTGSVTAGVIGTEKFSYDIWGDTVNIASRMESSGEPGRINISKETFQRVNKLFQCESRGLVKAKGKGDIEMYYLERILPEFSQDKEGLVPNQDFFLS